MILKYRPVKKTFNISVPLVKEHSLLDRQFYLGLKVYQFTVHGGLLQSIDSVLKISS